MENYIIPNSEINCAKAILQDKALLTYKEYAPQSRLEIPSAQFNLGIGIIPSVILKYLGEFLRFIRQFILCILIAIFPITSYATPKLEGFADIVEPLMPAVVNINTVKYGKKKQRENTYPEDMQIERFNRLFEQFGLPFFMDEMPSNPKATSLGSGFIIDAEGYIVTNHHVIKDADEISVKLNDNKEFTANLIGRDQKTDIAVLKIDTKTPLPFVRFGDSSLSRVGDWIIAIGNPFGLGGTVTTGIISSKSRDIDIIPGGFIDDYLQTDAAINGGNSGGPMFNMYGEVIGVNTAILTPSGTNIGIGFAIPSNSVVNIIKQLKSNGKIERGKLGIKIQELTPEIADGLGIEIKEGALLAGVELDSAAEKAGLKAGDIIIEYNNHPIKNVRKLQILVAETPLNTEVKIKALRKGKEIAVNAIIQESKEEVVASKEDSKTYDKQEGYEIHSVKFVDITDKISESFGLDIDKGVVVMSNQSKDSWSSLIRGDILVAVNQVQVSNVAQLKTQYELAKKSGKKNIVLLLKRSSTTLFLALPL